MQDKRELTDDVREGAHEALDEILDMYAAGYDLWIVKEIGWGRRGGPAASLRMVIKDDLP